MLIEIEDENLIEKSVALFRKELKAIAFSEQKKSWTLPSGVHHEIQTLFLKSNKTIIAIGLTEFKNRKAHLITTKSKTELLSPILEVNIPNKTNRRVAGLLANDDAGTIYLLHRGFFNIHRHPTKKQDAFENLSGFHKRVTDSISTRNVLCVTHLGSNMPKEIIKFTNAVLAFKSIVSQQRNSQ